MSQVNRPSLGWKCPPEWERFLEAVEREWGAIELYAGFEIEQAWREFRQEHPLEEQTHRLSRAVGLRDQNARKKEQLTRATDTGGTGRAWVSVNERVKGEMKAFATKNGIQVHEVLRSVVNWYLDGGLLEKITAKLERIAPEAEQQLEQLDPGSDGGLTVEDKKRQWLVNHLTSDDAPGAFTREDFGDALNTMPYRGGDTEHMREAHLQPVLNRLGYTEHPNNSTLFVPEEQAVEYAEDQGINPDVPAFERKHYDDLTNEERARGLRVELYRLAARHGGKRALRVDTVRSDVFDGTPGKRKVKALMDRAARVEGFETDAKGGTKRIRCNLEAVADPIVLADADRIVDTDPGKAGETDTTLRGDPEEARGGDPETGARLEMDRLMAATPTTNYSGDGK